MESDVNCQGKTSIFRELGGGFAKYSGIGEVGLKIRASRFGYKSDPYNGKQKSN